MLKNSILFLLVCFSCGSIAFAGDVKKETWDYTKTAKELSKKFTGSKGKVVPLGDSITYANQAGKWARYGKGKNKDEMAISRWMKSNKNDKSNGWWLAANDQPRGRSWTAASGITSGQYIKGGFHGLPSADNILKAHNPQIALIMLGTNDMKKKVTAEKYGQNMETIYKKCMANGTIPVACSVIPTTWGSEAVVKAYNEQIFNIAKKLKIPFVDLNGEFMKRRPGKTWLGTLISKDGAHPTHKLSAGPATEENLKNDGYLLKCYYQVHKVMEIKSKMKW
ncbi:MAG: hypothetical protein COA79_01705 [Planctomycetota bacterium]|nr:MAG: hypothetical protein COA79_01705 [Planctomycetota bacterium]